MTREGQTMIRVELGRETSPGIWEYAIPSRRLCGKSRQPLLDACRELERTGEPTAHAVGLFREGAETPSLTCSVAVGADTTVSETQKSAPRFVKYKPFEMALREAAE